MRNYEIMIIVKPTLNEDETKAVVEKFSSVLTDNEAKIVEAKEIGQRELTYEMKKFKSEDYYLYTIEDNNDKTVKEFDRLAGISSDIIRHLITRIEK